MKFSREFKNRYIYFVVFLMVALLTAGGILQYKNYLSDKRVRKELEENFEDYIEGSEPNSTAQIIEETVNGDTERATGDAQDATEVSNSGSVKITDDEQSTKKTTEPEESNTGSGNKPISAIKMEEPKLETMVVPVFGTIYTE
ncbi:MAG TPA: hypothetical protein PLI20_10585, partial [Bacillota bacterium]|nr:hypothetical protein [Bacillota bacterium]